MIKFFRQIRYQLMTENKTGKYFKYAIGEIVLVVIGILIALQINNWNNERIERQFETDVLKEILVNLQEDVVSLNAKIDFNNDKYNINRAILYHLKEKTPITDSLRIQYGQLIGRGAFQPITVAYENLKSKGIDIISNDSLRIAISKLYDFKYYYITDDIMEDYLPTRNAHEDVVFKSIRTTWGTDQGWLAEPEDLIQLQNDSYFQEVLMRALGFYVYLNKNYQNGIHENLEVQRKIETELMQRN